MDVGNGGARELRRFGSPFKERRLVRAETIKNKNKDWGDSLRGRMLELIQRTKKSIGMKCFDTCPVCIRDGREESISFVVANPVYCFDKCYISKRDHLFHYYFAHIY